MKKLIILFIALFLFAGTLPNNPVEVDHSEELALLSRLTSGGSEKSSFLPGARVLELALKGYYKLVKNDSLPHPEILTVIDFSLPSDKERMWVFNLNTGKLLFNILVAHGRNSGDVVASTFSNVPGSYTSSLGFYLTGEIYQGKHGLSLYLDGLERGINDKARERAIVIHGAEYATHKFINQYGRLGRSYGCPALPPEITQDVINTIKGGSCFFIYAQDRDYLTRSPLLN